MNYYNKTLDFLTPPPLDRLLHYNTSPIERNLPFLGELRLTAKALRRLYPEITSHSASLELLSHTLKFPNWNTLKPKLKKGFVFENVEEIGNGIMKYHYLDKPLTYDIETQEPDIKDTDAVLVDKPYMCKEAGIVCATFLHTEDYYKSEFIVLVWENGKNTPKRKLLTWENNKLLAELRYKDPDKFRMELQRIYDFETFFLFSERNSKRSSEEKVKKNIQVIKVGDIFACDYNGLFFEVVSVAKKSFLLHEIDSVIIDTPDCYDEKYNIGNETPLFFKPVPHAFKEHVKPFRKKLSGGNFHNDRVALYHNINGRGEVLESMKNREYLACSGVDRYEVEEMDRYSKRIINANAVTKKIENEIETGNWEKEIHYSFSDEDKEMFEEVMRHGYVYDKKQFAQRKGLPLWVEYKLAQDSSPTIRGVLAQKSFTDPLILELLAYDGKEHIRRYVALSPSLTLRVAEILFQDTDSIKEALGNSIDSIKDTEGLWGKDPSDEKYVRLISFAEKVLLYDKANTYRNIIAYSDIYTTAIDRIIKRGDLEECHYILDTCYMMPEETTKRLKEIVGRK